MATGYGQKIKVSQSSDKQTSGLQESGALCSIWKGVVCVQNPSPLNWVRETEEISTKGTWKYGFLDKIIFCHSRIELKKWASFLAKTLGK